MTETNSPAPPVAHTVTPCAFAASRSMDALRLPVVTSSLSLGSFSNMARGNGVRSRMTPTISNSASARAVASTSGNRSLNATTLCAFCRPDQSARLSATFW